MKRRDTMADDATASSSRRKKAMADDAAESSSRRRNTMATASRSRRRNIVAKKSRDWSKLPQDVWVSIILLLPLADFLRWASVCSYFGFIARFAARLRSACELPWHMRSGSVISELEFVAHPPSVSSKRYSIPLPKPLKKGHIIGSSNGWLIQARLPDARLVAFNPITRAQIPLPPTYSFPYIMTLPPHRVQSHNEGTAIATIGDGWELSLSFFKKAIFCSATSWAAVIHEYGKRVSFARIRDRSWTAIDTSRIGRDIGDIVFYNGLLYAIDSIRGRAGVFDLRCSGSGSGGSPSLITEVNGVGEKYAKWQKQLVILPDDGGLLLVCICPKIKFFSVLSLDHRLQSWVKVQSLDDHALLIGDVGCTSLKVESLCKYGRLKGNHIYLLRARQPQMRFGILQEGKFSWLWRTCAPGSGCYNSWFIPSLE